MQKLFIQFICTLFPNQIVNFAYDKVANPQFSKLRPHELEVLDKAEKETIPFNAFDIQCYTWKGGTNKVLLIHGWEGQAGNFADIVEQLLANDYTVYAFDGPSHGFSSKGGTSVFEFSDLVAFLIKKYEVNKLISHSFGGVATTYALSTNTDIYIEKYVLLTTPDKFSERLNDVAQKVGITEKVKQKLIQKFEAETNLKVADLNVSEFVKKVNVAKALIIHDINDSVIPIIRSQNVQQHWKSCELIEISGTGHFRILRTDTVIAKTIDFLNG